ncbi:hypothetical protein GCM10023317_12590 [Actinopolymorpha pittospori]
MTERPDLVGHARARLRLAELRGGGGVDVVDRDVGTAARQLQRVVAAEATARAGDQRDLPGQVLGRHEALPFEVGMAVCSART